MKLRRSWFSEHPRKAIRKLVEKDLDKAHTLLSGYAFSDQTIDDFSYQSAKVGAHVAVLMLLQYALVDPSKPRPWFCKISFKHVIEFDEFVELKESILSELLRRPPAMNYTMLVHQQMLVQLLTTMEIDDGN